MRTERVFVGTPAAEGIAIGTLVPLVAVATGEAPAAGSAEVEARRLDRAIAGAAQALRELGDAAGGSAADILEFQIELLDDPSLIDDVGGRIASGVPATRAWRDVLDTLVADYRAAKDDSFRSRAADLVDLRDRILAELTGAPMGASVVPSGAIVVARDLPPSRFLEMDWSAGRGLALVEGSASSHVAILARAGGVPLVVGLAGAETIDGGVPAILDGLSGRLITDPQTATIAAYQDQVRSAVDEAAAAEPFLTRPAITRSGERVRVLVNADDPRFLDPIQPTSCDGIGLTRTEFLFYRSHELPDEETQFRYYARLAEWAQGRPVTIRTLDAGGDKPIAGLTLDGETNPFLGLRGLRLSLARPDVFRVQLRALARAAVLGPVKVMLPMVTAPHELGAARALLATVVADLAAEGVPAAMPPLGMMVEVPAAALNIAAFGADFYSIGSNDLVQYVTAAGRDSAAVAALYDPLDPGVLELVRRIVRHGRDSGTEVSLCGDMAVDRRCLPALLDAGLRSVSVAPARLAAVKSWIAAHDGRGDA